MNSWQQKLEDKIRTYLKGYSACHDFWHLDRVRHNALKIAQNVPCDTEILEAAALLHDIGYKNFESDHKRHYIHSMEIAGEWLPEVGFPESKIAQVLEAIRLHDNFSWGHDAEKTKNIETQIIQDADRIEGIGAIGATRTIYYFGERGYPIYDNKPVPKSDEVWLNHSILDQLLRDDMQKWQNMNFAISKKISKSRNEFLTRFYDELKKELLDTKGE